MKHLISALLIIISHSILAQNKYQNVDSETFRKYVQDSTNILIDLRTEDEIARKGQIPGSKHIDFLSKDAEKEVDKLDKKKTYLVYCAGGGRSSECSEMMEKKGFRSVINLEKGFDDWKRKGFEVRGGQKK